MRKIYTRKMYLKLRLTGNDPIEMKSPAARPPAGRRRALAGPTLVCGLGDRPGRSKTGRPARGINARAFCAEFAIRRRRGLAARAVSGGVGIAIPVPGQTQLRPDTRFRRDDARRQHTGSASRSGLAILRPGPSPAALSAKTRTVETEIGRRSNSRGTGAQLYFGGVMSFSDTSPLGLPIRFAFRDRDLVGGACGNRAPGYARHPVSNAEGSALHATGRNLARNAMHVESVRRLAPVARDVVRTRLAAFVVC